MSVHRAPPVLSIHLKRFQYLVFGGSKINKPIAFAERLDMAPFLSFPKEAVRSGGAVYRLFAVLVHAGQSTDCGHYFSFVRAPNDAWFRCDDESVSRVPLAKVLEQQAYILYYTREGGAVGSSPKQPQPQPQQQSQPQPQQQSTAVAASSANGTDLGEVVAPAEKEKVCAASAIDTLKVHVMDGFSPKSHLSFLSFVQGAGQAQGRCCRRTGATCRGE
jgi:ubiquitin carboxyl-terminal hydrolase 36/42